MSLGSLSAVTMMTIMSRVFGSALTRLHTSKPDSFGIMMSKRMRSGDSSATIVIASRPLVAVTTRMLDRSSM